MEEDNHLKHLCKFCFKSFPCGRSLGGHMRSHVINSVDNHGNCSKKKLQSLNNGGNNEMGIEEGPQTGYGLRENPKKTSKFTDTSEDALFNQKLCRKCGKGFESWKALFGHMKCHSEKVLNCLEDDSWEIDDRKPCLDSQSESETAVPNRGKRSRRIKRYIANILNSNSRSFPSVSETEQEEQEEVAISLIMLSMDVVPNSSGSGEPSDNNSEFFEVGSLPQSDMVTEFDGKESFFQDCLKFKKLKNGNLEPAVFSEEKQQLTDPEISKIGFKSIQSEKFQGSEFGESISKKKRKFECTTCNRAFDSYQALGGHRASHKKMKNSENSFETEHSISRYENGDDKKIDESSFGLLKKNKKKNKNKEQEHECPICSKVFCSGQALGGHKRSHVINGQSMVVHKPVSEIREFFDLNLPAPAEDEGNDVGFTPWWGIGSTHRPEIPAPAVGLLTN